MKNIDDALKWVTVQKVHDRVQPRTNDFKFNGWVTRMSKSSARAITVNPDNGTSKPKRMSQSWEDYDNGARTQDTAEPTKVTTSITNRPKMSTDTWSDKTGPAVWQHLGLGHEPPYGEAKPEHMDKHSLCTAQAL